MQVPNQNLATGCFFSVIKQEVIDWLAGGSAVNGNLKEDVSWFTDMIFDNNLGT